MKRYISMLLAVLLLLSCMLTATPAAHAAEKTEKSRAIAIVFDNSGSMYEQSNQAWCRATYAMEVFASMLNQGDVLQIYPMWPIEIGGQEYTMKAPYQITDSSQASTIRDIFTPNASGTPIESIDCAAAGLKNLTADEKYIIVLTDGGTFSKNSSGLTKDRTKKELNKCVDAYASAEMFFMYLGIGGDACMPGSGSQYYMESQAVNTADVLSILTKMCNQIFGRDSLPRNRITNNNKTIEFDISMKKLIVFVQGENIGDLKLTGNGVGTLVSSQQTMYSTRGAGDYKSIPDESLQGMMVTYTDCAAGTYNIECTGSVSNTEVYYEPDADLSFVFTDTAGNTVDPNSLYEGDYKVSFGMKDGKTGKLIDSELLGNTHYEGSYFINGQEVPFNSDDRTGDVTVSLKMDDTFEAKLKVTYLSGYTITKDSSDFGWPEGGIKVAPRPAGQLTLDISGGEELYSLQELESGAPFIAKVFYDGAQLVGDELKKAELQIDQAASNANIEVEFADDHYKLSLRYKDPESPKDTADGPCTVPVGVTYTPQGSEQAKGSGSFAYEIKNDISRLAVSLFAPENYIVISEMDQCQPIEVSLLLDGRQMTEAEFARVTLTVDCSGIKSEDPSPNAADRSYTFKLLPTEGIAEGDYLIKVNAVYKDEVGQEATSSDSVMVTLSAIPMWLRWVIGLGIFLVLAIIAWTIAHIKAMPSSVTTPAASASLTIGVVTFDKGKATFPTRREGTSLMVLCKKGTKQYGLRMKVAAGEGSYISTPQKGRSMIVQPGDVSLQAAGAKITEANINGTKFAIDPVTKKFGPAKQNAKPITLKHGSTVKFSGTVLDEMGKQKSFSVSTKLDFTKK